MGYTPQHRVWQIGMNAFASPEQYVSRHRFTHTPASAQKSTIRRQVVQGSEHIGLMPHPETPQGLPAVLASLHCCGIWTRQTMQR